MNFSFLPCILQSRDVIDLFSNNIPFTQKYFIQFISITFQRYLKPRLLYFYSTKIHLDIICEHYPKQEKVINRITYHISRCSMSVLKSSQSLKQKERFLQQNSTIQSLLFYFKFVNCKIPRYFATSSNKLFFYGLCFLVTTRCCMYILFISILQMK